MGNTDADSLNPSDAGATEGWLRKYLMISAWAAPRLDEEDRAYLSQASRTLELELEGAGSLLCVHGSPVNQPPSSPPATRTSRCSAGTGIRFS
jgi:hypothetical protein